MLRVWVGLDADGQANAPAPSFSLSGQQVVPAVVRAWGRALPTADTQAAAIFCGLFDLPLPSGTAAQLRVQTSGCTSEQLVRALPTQVPGPHDSPRNRFNVLLMSCYDYSEEATRGVLDSLLAELRSSLETRPDLTLMAGDQVYLDMPLLKNFADQSDWLLRKFHEDYRRNWFERIPGVLSAAPAVHVPDDHEYWNNYPHTSPIIRNAETDKGRERWSGAAGAMFAAFQHHAGLDPTATATEPWLRFDVDPLSFFVADLRSQRSFERAFTLPPAGHDALKAWANDVRNGKYGVFISGQSLCVEAATPREGKWADWELKNYRDYTSIMQTLGTATETGRTLLCLTGDVHWGRMSRFVSDQRKLVEIIASPAALVSDPRASFKALFRPGQDFPRHTDGEPTPDFIIAGRKLTRDPTVSHQQRGDHVALLSFQRTEKGLTLRVTYYPVHRDRRVRAKTHQLELSL